MDRYLSDPAVANAMGAMPSPSEGDDYASLLLDLLRPHLDLATVKIGDVCETLELNEPIEIAFYDCLKTDAIDRGVWRRAARHYVPGTLIMQQDFFYDRAPDHKIRQELMAEYFDYVGQASSSALFRMAKSLPPAWFEHDPVDRLSPDDKTRLMTQAAERSSTALGKGYVLLSLADFEWTARRRPQALLALEMARAAVAGLPDDRLGHFTSRHDGILRRLTGRN